MNTKQTHLKTELKGMIQAYPNSLRSEVAAEALKYDDNIEAFFTALLAHGCQSGMIGSLVYFHDTHAFYDKHYEEIEELRYELEHAFGESLKPQGDLKNWYAWMAFEETARLIADEFIQI